MQALLNRLMSKYIHAHPSLSHLPLQLSGVLRLGARKTSALRWPSTAILLGQERQAEGASVPGCTFAH